MRKTVSDKPTPGAFRILWQLTVQDVVAPGLLSSRQHAPGRLGSGHHPEGETTMADESRYNGWTNYGTWCVHLWLSNEETSWRHWQAAAREAYADARDDQDVKKGTFTRKESAAFVLKNQLKESHEGAAGLEDAQRTITVFTDLIRSALDTVNWAEIAENLLEGCEDWDDD
jgi:hypothetical protein